MPTNKTDDLIKVSVRMPKNLLKKVSRLHPKANISEIVRQLFEGEVSRQKVFKAHMDLYGKFTPKDFDESLL